MNQPPGMGPPQGFSQPPQANYPPDGTYANDKTIGIIIMVFSVCGIIAGGLIVLGGGFLAAAGATGATSTAGTSAAGASALAAGGGAILMITGVITLLLSIVNIASGYGIMKSLRWGFILGAVLYGIHTLLSLVGLTHPTIISLIFLLVDIGIVYYCIARLTGKLGTAPM